MHHRTSSSKCHASVFLFQPAVALLFFLSLCASVHGLEPSPQNNSQMEPYYLFPASISTALVSFDWDGEGLLHFTVGDPAWGLRLQVFKAEEPDLVPVFASESVWAGSQITCIDNRIYFNDGGDYIRSDFNYYVYDADIPEVVSPLLEAPYDASLWGVTARNSNELFASGSSSTWGPASFFYSGLDASGNLESVPPVLFGEIGDSPGPMVFNPQGDLYYVPGYAYSGTAFLYRWGADEVNAALADPIHAALAPTGHSFSALPTPYDGATGIAADESGNVYVTATSWGAPSLLLVYKSGSSTPLTVAEYDGRLETVRYRDHAVYVSCAEGIFRIPFLSVESALENTALFATTGETVVFAVEATGGVGERHYQWYRMDGQDKADVPVGGNLTHYPLTAALADSGASFYCVVSDAVYTAESPHFTLIVQVPTPVSTLTTVILTGIAISFAGALLFVKRAMPRKGSLK